MNDVKTKVVPVEKTDVLPKLWDNESNKLNVAYQNEEQTDVKGYRDRIMENLYIGAKAIYLVARDLFEAEAELGTVEYAKLRKLLPISDSTERRYKKLGGSIYLDKLFEQGQLPMGWTVCYSLSTLDEKMQNAIESKIVPTITQAEVNQLIKDNGGTIVSQTKPSEHHSFVTVKFIKEKMSSVQQVNDALKCLNDFRQLDFVYLEKDDEKINDYKKSFRTENNKKSESTSITSADAKKEA